MALILLTLACASTHAALYSTTFNVNSAIPDGNPSGLQSSFTLSGLQNQIIDINVTLNISGGWNGDLYAYIRHGDGFSVLLNQVGTPGNFGFGYGDSGFLVRLDDEATQSVNIHLYQTVSYSLNGSGQLTGDWRPDGGSLTSFDGLDPNGTWTIFFADLSSGDTSTLVSWGLEIQAIPEPTTWALIIFAAIAGISQIPRLFRFLSHTSPELNLGNQEQPPQ